MRRGLTYCCRGFCIFSKSLKIRKLSNSNLCVFNFSMKRKKFHDALKVLNLQTSYVYSYIGKLNENCQLISYNCSAHSTWSSTKCVCCCPKKTPISSCCFHCDGAILGVGCLKLFLLFEKSLCHSGKEVIYFFFSSIVSIYARNCKATNYAYNLLTLWNCTLHMYDI